MEEWPWQEERHTRECRWFYEDYGNTMEVAAIVIIADYDKICHDNDCRYDKLMHAHLHLNRK